MELLIIFIVLNVVNVILQTVRSLVTIKCNKWVAALVNAVAYGLYTVVIVYTVCDLPLWLKAVIVAVANLIGVFCVKIFEEKSEKEKLWKIEITVPSENMTKLWKLLRSEKISFNYLNPGNNEKERYYIVNCFCKTKKESEKVKGILKVVNAKYFVSESKIL